MYDLKITGGTLVDGTGAPTRTGDVAIKDGTIVAIGDCPGEATETIDATGHIVTPGFVDIHTHYDGQVSWDSDMAPSSIHGVTTAVIGSCGVGFAPCREGDRDQLIKLMEGVEDIPGSALAEGMQWDWETFPEYMDAIDKIPHTIDLCTQVPHDSLRVYVMGDRALAEEPATEADIAGMQKVLAEALDAGAFGFSTGRSDNHRSAEGLPTPASEAHENELVGLAEVFAGRDHGVLQFVNDFDILDGDDNFHNEFDLVEAMVRAGGGRPLSLSLMQRDQSPDQWTWVIDRVEKLRAEGLPVHFQCAPRGIGVILGLEATFHPFIGFPSYKAIHDLPLAERVARMQDPEFKAQLLTESSEPLAGDGSSIPPLADMLLQAISWIVWRVFKLGEVPNYEPELSTSIGFQADAAGIDPLDAIYDAMLENEGHALLYFPIYNYLEGNLENVATMMKHDAALPGLSDGGAHVGTICDASFPTFYLTHWVRDRPEGRVALETAIHWQTKRTADYMGLNDRGSLEVGKRADINVIDLEGLTLEPPKLVQDLPAGGQRLIQKAHGYKATLVAGQVITRNGELTGAMPGRVVRAGA
ncbi:MAG: amidohydrolase family protein [Deltaproteobacteria bacterium]|nr:amidohydrolase family protein [Deltaproteobacteria bacterium]